MRFVYLLSYEPHEAELAHAEASALCGARADSRVCQGPVRADVTRAAYIKLGAELWASAQSLDELVTAAAQQGAGAERFRITVVKLPPKPQIPSPRIAGRVAAVIAGRPNLRTPVDELVVVASEGSWQLGRIFTRADRSYLEYAHRPQSYSSALLTRLARAMVNLVASPGDTILDPMCGSGTIALEAWSIGVRAVSYDINPKLAAATALNLRYFGYPAWVAVADARALPVPRPAPGAWAYDAIVTDLPYGRMSGRDAGLYEGFFAHARTLAPRMCVVAAEPLGNLLEAAGFGVRCVARAGERGLVRHVHVAEVQAP